MSSKNYFYDNVFDENSIEENYEIEKIINIISENFKDELYVIKILLSPHYNEFHEKFFEKIKSNDKSIFQAIKKELRNNLNPYRLFISKKNKIKNESKEGIELFNLLNEYYKDKNNNIEFFINYFRDLKNMLHKKSKLINMIPKNEIETLNDIHRRMIIINTLRNNLNKTIQDKLPINYEQKKEVLIIIFFM